jgi:hypothetical protein
MNNAIASSADASSDKFIRSVEAVNYRTAGGLFHIVSKSPVAIVGDTAAARRA